MSKQQFYVRGTSCKSCEVVIERELLKLPNIESANVSHNQRTITLQTKGDTTYSRDSLNLLLKKHDYSLTKKDKGASMKERVNWGNVGVVVVLVLALYVIFSQLGLLRLSPSSAEPAGLIAIIGVGVIASLSSCTAVVGGLVAAVSSSIAKDQVDATPKQKLYPHLLFNLGRIGGFFVFGAVIGYLGSAIQLSPALNGVFIISVAALMVVIGVNLVNVFPSPVIGMPKWLAHKVHDLTESKDPKAPLLLGAMTFFLPCGFTQSMQLFAITLQDPLQSGIVMAAFALGTAPVLLGIGGAASYASEGALSRLTKFAGIIVLILGISNIGNGLALLGVTPGTVFASSGGQSGGDVTLQNGRQQIAMTMTSRGVYDPSVLTVQAGIPVDWNITGDDFMGCGDTLIMPAFGINTNLQTGPNLVQFTPNKPGRYSFSCSMGMIRGTMVVTSAN